jgi:hypothetical protein
MPPDDARVDRPIHICVRATLDWRDEALVRAQILPRFRAKFETWNATLTMPYHVYRQRVKEIAELSLARVEGAERSRFEDVPMGHVVIPVDDDDWFAPDLAARLAREQTEGITCFLWRQMIIERSKRIRKTYLRLAALVGRGDRVICKTNTYAFVNAPGMKSVALSHELASTHFLAHPASVRRIPARLAVQNRHLGSQTTLRQRRPTVAPERLVELLALHQARYRAWRLPGDLQWAKPYVDLMTELLHEVRAKSPAARGRADAATGGDP